MTLVSEQYHLTSDFNPSKIIIQRLTTHDSFCLFLDIDGTLSAFHNDPSQSFIPKTTLDIIERIITLGIPVIAVTGRPIEVAQKLFEPLTLPIAGLHGLKIELDCHTHISPDLSTIDFKQIKQSLQSACADYPQLLLEDKTHSFALHYRQCPWLEPVAQQIMQQLHAMHPLMKLNHGKCVIELLPKQADKGHAINTILRHLNQNHVLAIFIGDDITDENGFKAINDCGGLSIKVGGGMSQAQYRLQDINAVADFLKQFEQFLDRRTHLKVQARHGEKACLS